MSIRLDKWLWAARLFKTRSLAADDIDRGRVLCNGMAAKPSRELRVGDRLTLKRVGFQQELVVNGLSTVRGPAPVAQLLYAETAESLAARARAAEQRRLGTEPALSQEQGRPTKRDRRQLADWQRWSVSLDDEASA
ncbi:MAG: RNA-binding S4 domain-containing protein [Rubrivivax sp.]|jgi:ribosome-associated heat shock protein Hsp15|nr:RNA-binding S4 domain-containing protein [Rubrivivax sp.]